MTADTLSPAARAVLTILLASFPKALTLSDIWDKSELANVDEARAAVDELQRQNQLNTDRDGRGRVFYTPRGSALTKAAPSLPSAPPPSAEAAKPAAPSTPVAQPAMAAKKRVQLATFVPEDIELAKLLDKAEKAPRKQRKGPHRGPSPLGQFIPVIEKLKAKGYSWQTMAEWFGEIGIICTKYALANVYAKHKKSAKA